MFYNRNFTYFILAVLLISGCAVTKPASMKRDIHKFIEKSPVFSNYFVGFSLYDLEADQFIAQVNDHKYFTPASNIKLLTLATFLSTKKDSLTTFYQNPQQPNQLLSFADPTLLHPDFTSQNALKFLNSLAYDTLEIYLPAVPIDHYGPGWAWDDYTYDYQAERSLLPLYGNLISVQSRNGSLRIDPSFFNYFIEIGEKTNRERNYNFFQLNEKILEKDSSTVYIPFIPDRETTARLLEDTLQKTIRIYQDSNWSYKINWWNGIQNTPTKAVLALMMQRSDNFLADQLLIQAQLLKKFSYQEAFLSHVQKSVFNNLSDSLIWVDGSGLSRYNMVTPRSMVNVLQWIYENMTWEDICMVFPAGGKSGTIRNWHINEQPYVYAKTGTLRHNHALSGYLLTKSGKTLIFSFMHNHYTTNSFEVKLEMQKLLRAIHDNY